ncbi:DUF6191 domain-containing protein [Streptomyces sp. NPDC057638]|uniref:DUF6191 domain-containing protein n=1 Tax=Streptomyces sp. NPDC057638 TaxID=3346190 RepID=UPI0036BBFD9C
MFNAIQELFAPGSKHTQDERHRIALTRTDVGDADPHRGPIDLASGKVVIRRDDLPEAGGEASPEGGGEGDAARGPGADATAGPGNAPGTGEARPGGPA